MTRPVWRSAAALALVAGACATHGGAKTTDRVGADQTTSAVGPPSSNDSIPPPSGAAKVSRPPATRRGQSPTTVRGDTNPASNNRTGTVDASRQRPGQYAGVLLAPGTARTIVLDVRVEAGVVAGESTVNRVAQILRQQSNKTVTIQGPTPLADTAQTHDADSIRRLADSQGVRNTDDTAVVHLFYLKGHFAQNGVLGVTVRADTTAVFPDDIASASSPLVSESRIEQAVVTHEVGHVLGLVDMYLNDNRDDPDHPGHSPNRGSVMFWAIESDVVSQVLGGPPPVDFDQADLADLQKIHAGASAPNG